MNLILKSKLRDYYQPVRLFGCPEVAGAGWLAGPARVQRKQPAPIRSAKLADPISRPCVCGRGFKQQVHQPFGWAAAELISPANLAQPNRLYIYFASSFL